MDFLYYLAPDALEIYQMASQRVRFAENTQICRDKDYYGWYNFTTSVATICTDRILQGSSGAYYLRETLFHELAHAAQDCKNGLDVAKPFGLAPDAMPLAAERKANLERSLKHTNASLRHVEHEAFWLEDKPGKLKWVLQKYCL